jgi:hypothetical protein
MNVVCDYFLRQNIGIVLVVKAILIRPHYYYCFHYYHYFSSISLLLFYLDNSDGNYYIFIFTLNLCPFSSQFR